MKTKHQGYRWDLLGCRLSPFSAEGSVQLEMKGSRRSDGWVSMLSTVLGVSNCILADLFSDHEI